MAQDTQTTNLADSNDDSDKPVKPTSVDNTLSNGQDQSSISSRPASQVVANIPVPDEAADSDLIEKEWVERAKQIVEHTKDDPHEQQRAVSQMKADYLKKRYNRDINTPKE